jgi:hypothetical protein
VSATIFACSKAKPKTHLGFDNELVRSVHLTFLFLVLVDDRVVETETGSGSRESGLGGLADLLRGSGGFSGSGIGSFTFGGGSRFGFHRSGDFFLGTFLDEGSTLERETSGKVETSLNLDELFGTFGRRLDSLYGVLSDPGVDSSGKLFRVGVLRLELERFGTGEREDLGRRDGVSDVESENLGTFVGGGVGGSLPREFDGEELSVESVEFTNLENGGNLSASEGGTTGDSLVLVRGEGERSTEEVLDALLEGRDTSRSTNEFDRFDVLLGESGSGEGTLERGSDLFKDGGDEFFEFFALHGRGGIDVVHDRFDREGSEGVGGENLLELLDGGRETEDSLLVRVDVDLVLGLELLGKVLNEGVVEVTSTEVTVESGTLDDELTLVEGNDRNGVIRVSDIDEDDVSGGFTGGGEVGLGDTVTEGGGSGVVDETERVESSDFGSIDNCSSLSLSVPNGDGDRNVVDGSLEFGGSGISELGEVHGVKLSRRESGLFSDVVDLFKRFLISFFRCSDNARLTHVNTNSVSDLDYLSVHELLLDFDIRVAAKLSTSFSLLIL